MENKVKRTMLIDKDIYMTLNREYGDVSDVAVHLLGEEALRVKEETEALAREFRSERSWRLHRNARRSIIRKDGEWVLGRDLRPNFEDREIYTEPLWESLKNDPDIEVREIQHGPQVRRSARYRPLV